jgi:isopentenyl-diphosphate delta-isomerase
MSLATTDQSEHVVLVDAFDNDIGTMGKMEAHQVGALHRAFSVFVFNSSGELLLQRRAIDKYHSGNLWTNTCCSHPRAGEPTLDAAHRRLREEMGMACDLTDMFSFTYRTEFDDGLIEHEIDHVFVGYSDEAPNPVPS